MEKENPCANSYLCDGSHYNVFDTELAGSLSEDGKCARCGKQFDEIGNPIEKEGITGRKVWAPGTLRHEHDQAEDDILSKNTLLGGPGCTCC